MAESAKNKQLGTVYIDTSKLKKNLEEVNQQLASIGKGANLDISKQMEAKLAPIKKQIQEITNAAKEGAKKSSQATDFETRAILVSLESRVKKSQDMAKQREKDEETLQQKLKAMNDRDEAEQKRRVAEQIKAVADANKQITKSHEEENKARAAKEKEVTDELNKIRSEELKQRQTDFKVLLEHKERQAREEVEIEKQMAADADRIREQSLKQRQLDFQALLDQKTRQAEEEIAQEKRVVAEATENYKQYLTLRKQLESMTPEQQANSQQAAVIKQQLKEKKEAFDQYSEAIRQQVYADGSVVNMEEDLARAQAKQRDAQAAQAQAYADKLGERFVSRLGQAEIKLLKDQWSAAVEYASSYYDAMNEIRVVTGKSEQDAERIGASYRRLAKEMKVTSTELSQAAITFYRQGQSDGEVNKRLEAVTKYAKIANIEFEKAAELVTSTTNSMGVDVNKVIDVFLMLGDSAATSGEEIAKGMQKSAAAAATFGQDFEWLATYIATVSETLRTAPESIGNAFNTMLARMHSIKQNGFNSEDATTINDVAKALKTVGIEQMNQNGKWMELEDIYIAIAEKWDTLNDKQKSYIATAMANTRQQNVFYALMNDMSKGLEGGSRAWELYEKAVNSAGTATEKYATWQESVAASQANMNRALEDLYANLQPTLIKGWYDTVAGIVDALARGTDVLGGWNIIIPGLIVGVAALDVVLKKTTGTATQLNGVLTAMQAHPVIAAVTAFILAAGTVSALIGGIAGSFETAAVKYDKATQRIDESNKKIENLKTLQSDMDNVFEKASSNTKMTSAEIINYNKTLDSQAEISPKAKQAVEDLKDGLIDQKEAARLQKEELDGAIEAQETLSKLDYMKAFNNASVPDSVKNNEAASENIYQGIIDEYGNGSLLGYMLWQAENLFEADADDNKRKLADTVGDAIKEVSDQLIYMTYDDVRNAWINGDSNITRLIETAVYGAQGIENADYEKAQEEASEFIEELIGYYIKGFTDFEDAGEVEVAKEKLREAFYGEDGMLDLSKVLDAKNVIRNTDLSTDSGQALIQLVKSIFSEDTFKKLEGELTGVAEQGDFTDAVTAFLVSLISAGLSNVQIEDLLKGVSLQDWNWDSLQADMLWENGDGDFVFPDEDAKQMIERMLSLGVSFEEIKKAANNSKSLEEFKESLKGINETAAEGTGGENEGSVIKYADEIQKLTAEMEKAQTAQEAMKSGEPMSFDDLLDLTNAHPELLQAMTDLETFKKALERLAEQDKKQADQRMKDWAASQEGSAAVFNGYISQNQGRYGIPKQTAEWTYAVASVNTLQELRDLAEEKGDAEMLQAIDNYLNLIVINGHHATAEVEALKDAATEAIEHLEKAKTLNEAVNGIDPSNSSYDPAKVIGNFATLEKEFPELKDMERGSIEYLERAKTLVGETTQAAYDMAAAYGVVSEKVLKAAQLQADMQQKIQQYASDGERDKRFENADANTYLEAVNYLKEAYEKAMTEEGEGGVEAYVNALKELDDAGILEGMVQTFGDISTIAEESGGSIEEVERRLEELRETAQNLALNELAESIKEERELNRAESLGYSEQLGAIGSALDTEGIEAAAEVYKSFDERMQAAIAKTYPQLIEALNDVNKAAKKSADGMEDLEESSEDAENAANGLRRELNEIKRSNSARYFTDTEKAISGLRNGTMSLGDAYSELNGDIKNADKAIDQYNDGVATLAAGMELTESDVSALASYLGDLDPTWVLNNWSQIGPMLSAAMDEGIDAIDRFNAAAVLNILGTSDVDFSALYDGLILAEDEADALIQMLLATGQWKVEEHELVENAPVFVPNGMGGGHWSTVSATGVYRTLVPTGENPFASRKSNLGKGGTAKKSSGSRGGGGGGSKKNSDNPTSSSANQMTEIERMLDIMEQIQKIQEHTRSIYEAQAKYYETTGELQGVIAYYELEKKAIADQNATLEANIKDIEAQMYAKQAEVAAMSTSSEAYETAAKDLEKLQSTHQSYTKELLSNKTEMENLTKAIKKQQDTIRDMEIDLRKTIYQAIEDREALIERKLQGRITLENEILDLIQKRYEKERDMILENSQAQIDALESERDLLAEQLQLRREQAEEQDKAAQLAELETQYERIVADPTRRKEALDIQKQIKNLREEMAWDLAEKEVEAQQKSIDDQITSIEDYMEYVRNYYDEMFEHPQKLVAEMESIITQTDEYIIEWLKNNSEEYANVTAARATDMENAWGQMLLDMHGALKLYWDEVESIIEQGDEAIINFLVQNSADYKAAGKLQAQAYVDQWLEMLQKLAQAHKQIIASMVASSYVPIQPSTYSGSNNNNSSGSSGGKGGTGSSSSSMVKLYLVYDPKVGPVAYFHNYSEAQMERNDRSDPNASIREVPVQESAIKNGYYNGIRVFKEGGMADFTGPAWLDGTKTRPERILSPVQTELFESLVRSLETMAKVKIPSMPAFGDDLTAGGNPINVGDIIVNVDKMDNDADYEELAERVFETIMARLNRGSVVGGIRF